MLTNAVGPLSGIILEFLFLIVKAKLIKDNNCLPIIPC